MGGWCGSCQRWTLESRKSQNDRTSVGEDVGLDPRHDDRTGHETETLFTQVDSGQIWTVSTDAAYHYLTRDQPVSRTYGLYIIDRPQDATTLLPGVHAPIRSSSPPSLSHRDVTVPPLAARTVICR